MRVDARGIALAILLFIAVLGLATRWMDLFPAPAELPSSSADILSPGLRLSEGAFVERIVRKPLPGLQLRLSQCSQPAYVFPILIKSAEEPQTVELAFSAADYSSVDVYRGEVRRRFDLQTRLTSYVLARIAKVVATRGLDSAAYKASDFDLYFVRSLVPKACKDFEAAPIEWAKASRPFYRKIQESR